MIDMHKLSAERGKAAFDAFKSLHEDREETQLRDLLADLMHLAQASGIDFEHELSMATDFYGDEQEDE